MTPQPEFWQFLKQQGATSLSGVPYSWEMLKKLRFIRMDLPSLKTLTQAGGKLRPGLHRELAEWAGQKGMRFLLCTAPRRPLHAWGTCQLNSVPATPA
jgi:acyl-coenzyme A synthetase/AMP-(fatty) acid ligase